MNAYFNFAVGIALGLAVGAYIARMGIQRWELTYAQLSVCYTHDRNPPYRCEDLK